MRIVLCLLLNGVRKRLRVDLAFGLLTGLYYGVRQMNEWIKVYASLMTAFCVVCN